MAKKGIFKKVGEAFKTAGHKIAKGAKKAGRETVRVVEHITGFFQGNVDKSGIGEAIGTGSVGIGVGVGANTGANIYYQPPNSQNSIGYGIQNGTGKQSFFINNQAVQPRPSISNHLAERDQLLQSIYGPGYIAESSLAVISIGAIVGATKELINDTIATANFLGEMYLNTWATIYSSNDLQRSEALNRNIAMANQVVDAVNKVVASPEKIPKHFEQRAQSASKAFAIAYLRGNLLEAGSSVGQVLYDASVIASLTSSATKFATKNVKQVVNETNKFIAANNFRSPIAYQYNVARLNSGYVSKHMTGPLTTSKKFKSEHVRSTGARELNISEITKAEKLAEIMYTKIRSNPNDIAMIAKSTGLKEFKIKRIKDHLFFKEHKLRNSIGKFDADPVIVESWKRLESSNFTSKDIQLLSHELFESKFEGIFKTDYLTSHNAANRAGYISPVGGLSAEHLREIYFGFLHRFG